MAEVKIAAELRTEFGKGAARRTRRDHKVPAVLYGHGQDPRHISLPGHDLMKALKVKNALLSIDIEGKNELAIAKDVQRDPIKGFLEHVDLLVVRRGEKVKVDVAIHVIGDAVPDALVNSEMNTIEVMAEATHIPTSFEVDITGRAIGTQIQAKDIALPAGVELVTEPEHLVINIVAVQSAESLEADLAGAEAELGIEKDEPETEGEAAPAAEAAE